jgi:hypothetical protein
VSAPPARPKRQSLGAIFLVPAVIAVVSSTGLLSALLGDGLWDAVSWLTLAVPIAIAGWFGWLRRRRR